MNRTKLLYRATLAAAMVAGLAAAVLALLDLSRWALAALAVAVLGSLALGHLRMRLQAPEKRARARHQELVNAIAALKVSTETSNASLAATTEAKLDRLVGQIEEGVTGRFDDVEAVVASSESVLMAEFLEVRQRISAVDRAINPESGPTPDGVESPGHSPQR